MLVCARLCRGRLGVFCKLSNEARPVVWRSANPSFIPESGALAVVWWIVPGCICSFAGFGSVFGVVIFDNSRNRLSIPWRVLGVAITLSMDCCSAASGVSSLSRTASR